MFMQCVCHNACDHSGKGGKNEKHCLLCENRGVYKNTLCLNDSRDCRCVAAARNCNGGDGPFISTDLYGGLGNTMAQTTVL